MSAAATAAGYLYASGRLRGRGSKDQEHEQQRPEPAANKEKPRQEIRVAVYQPEAKPKRTPKIEYRTRRTWKPE